MKSQSFRWKRGFGATLVAGAAVVALALPAFALSGSGSSGSGTLTTHLTLQSHPNPSCARAGNNFGATTDFSSATLGTYSGAVTIDWLVNQANGPWYEGPDATYGNHNAACANGHSGDPWDITGSVSGTNGSDSVSCTSLTGTYRRTNDVDIVVGLSGNCSVNGGSASATTFAITQTVGTCVDDFAPFFIPESCDTSGDAYTAT